MPPTGGALATNVSTLLLPPDTGLPANGFGGSWYELNFEVPVYNQNHSPHVANTINWYMTDQFVESTANAGSIYGFSFGICLLVYLFVIVLTPRSKMGRPFFIFYILALTCETVRTLLDTVRVGKLGLSPYSAYLGLTGDVESTTWSTGYINLSITKQAVAIFSYCFTITCLWIQAYSLLRHIRFNHSHLYWGIMGSLTAGSLATLVFDIMYAYSQTRRLQKHPTGLDFKLLTSGTWMGLALSFACWSLLSAGSVIHIIYTRIRFGIRGNGVCQFTVALLLLATLDSFVVPITLCLLGLIPNRFDITKATSLVTPAVLALLPITFIFTTTHRTEMNRGRQVDSDDDDNSNNNHNNNNDEAERGDRKHDKRCARCIGRACGSSDSSSNNSTTLEELTLLPETQVPTRHQRQNPFRDPVRDLVDRELAEIDAMETPRTSHESEDLVVGHVPDEQVLQQRARRVMRNLAERNITPRTSQTKIT